MAHRGARVGPSCDSSDEEGDGVRSQDADDEEASAFAVPPWAKDAGRWSWIIVGVAIVILGVFALAAATRLLVLATLFAVLLGGAFLPVVDWLGRHHVPRWRARCSSSSCASSWPS